MLAVVKERPGPGFSLRETDIPEPREDQVLVRVKAVGICGTDIPILEGAREVPVPLIPGHEFAGEIAGVGAGVREWRVGDRVTAGLVISCGECFFCREGLESLCDNLRETGIHVNGAFAEYVVVPEKTLHRLPDGMSFEEGASIDPVASAYRGVRKAHVSPGDVVVVFGPGPIGLYALQIARMDGAKKVLCVGVAGDEERLALAMRLGADYTVLTGDRDPADVVREVTRGRMADVVVEATGRPEVFDACVRSLRKGGRLSLAGIFHESTAASLSPVVRRELQITGSICYTSREFHECVGLVHRGSVRVEPVISHRFPLTDIARALDLLREKKAVKVILFP